nr:immunoglobulin heavy chain junction region [Mus musculus]
TTVLEAPMPSMLWT